MSGNIFGALMTPLAEHAHMPPGHFAISASCGRRSALRFRHAEQLAIAVSTENLVSNENLPTLSAVLEHAGLPLMPDIVDRIDQLDASPCASVPRLVQPRT